MSHHVANKHSRDRVGDLYDLKKSPPTAEEGRKKWRNRSALASGEAELGNRGYCCGSKAFCSSRAVSRSSSNSAFFSRSSAAYLASCSSTCLRAVMSRVVETKPISSPFSSRRGIFVTDIQTLFPARSTVWSTH